MTSIPQAAKTPPPQGAPKAPCPVRPWCVMAHKADPARAERHGEPLTITLPGDRELLSIALADLADPHGPEAWVAGTDTADLTVDQLAALIGQFSAALPRLRAMHSVLVASRASGAEKNPGVPA